MCKGASRGTSDHHKSSKVCIHMASHWYTAKMCMDVVTWVHGVYETHWYLATRWVTWCIRYTLVLSNKVGTWCMRHIGT